MNKTLALICIAKNEEKHVERFLNSFLPVVDHVYFTDTGSTDKTVEIAKRVGGDKITISHFEWCHDFAKARNFSQKDVKEDYILWADLDDALGDEKSFMQWKHSGMEMADMWLATYNYAIGQDGKVFCSFARERVYKNEPRFTWKYALHEGVNADGAFNAQFIGSWCINHLRTPDDLAKDKGRNLRVFEELIKREPLDARMTYYYGKELYEAGKYEESLKELLKANGETGLELHDRILCIQYACFILLQMGKIESCINLAHSGLLLAPMRAEFFVIVGDAYLKQGKTQEAVAWFEAAKACKPMPDKGFTGFIFQHKEAYTHYPRNQLARIYVHQSEFDKAIEEAEKSFQLFGDKESEVVAMECRKVKTQAMAFKTAIGCDDIVFTCPGGLYEWDEGVYETKGIGGSETATVELAKWLKKLTGRRVIVFNERKTAFTSVSDVEYRPISELVSYFSKFKPTLHIAWRHNFKMTEAKTLVWSHDLVVPGGENTANYDKYLALSDFHKDFVHSMLGVPKEKIHVTKNGIDPKKLKFNDPSKKDPFKIVYVSSPDRGLERAVQICEILQKDFPVKLHVFYGMENLLKMGKQKEYDFFKQILDKPFVVNHGNVSQSELMKHYEDAAIWLYPTNFMETFCISALETSLSGVHPVVRAYGALPNTLNGLPATILDRDCETLEDYLYWANEVSKVIQQKLWLNRDEGSHSKLLHNKSWEQVAREWMGDFISDGTCI